MPTVKKTIQLYRNGTLIVPDQLNEKTAYEVAIETLEEMTPVDGEIVSLRYQETGENVKTLIAVYNNAFNGNDSGWTVITEQPDLSNYYTKSEIDTNNFVVAQALSQLNEDIESYTETDPVFIASPAHGITSNDITNWNGKISQQKRVIGFSISENNAVSFTDESGTSLTHQQVHDLVSDNNNDIEFSSNNGDIYRVGLTDNTYFSIDQTITTGDIADGITYNHYFFTYSNNTYIISENIHTQLLTGDATDTLLANQFPFINKKKYVSTTPSGTPHTIDPYQINDLGTINMGANIQLVFNSSKEVSGYAAEYIVRFVSGTNAKGVTLPSSVLWANGTAPTYVSGHTYEINVVNNLAVVGEFY